MRSFAVAGRGRRCAHPAMRSATTAAAARLVVVEHGVVARPREDHQLGVVRRRERSLLDEGEHRVGLSHDHRYRRRHLRRARPAPAPSTGRRDATRSGPDRAVEATFTSDDASVKKRVLGHVPRPFVAFLVTHGGTVPGDLEDPRGRPSRPDTIRRLPHERSRMTSHHPTGDAGRPGVNRRRALLGMGTGRAAAWAAPRSSARPRPPRHPPSAPRAGRRCWSTAAPSPAPSSPGLRAGPTVLRSHVGIAHGHHAGGGIGHLRVRREQRVGPLRRGLPGQVMAIDPTCADLPFELSGDLGCFARLPDRPGDLGGLLRRIVQPLGQRWGGRPDQGRDESADRHHDGPGLGRNRPPWGRGAWWSR